MMDQADFLEEFSEALRLRQMHFVLDKGREPSSAQEFVAYCINQNEHDLHAKRANDGKSFFQRREEKRK
jgi:hypothetical protein